MALGDYIIIALIFATFGVLLAGIMLMGIGGKANRRYSNKLMVARVSLQALVILMLLLMYSVSK